MSLNSKDFIQEMFAAALEAVEPSSVVARAIQELDFAEDARVIVVAVGKAAERMALGARDALGERIAAGYVITKDDHVSGLLDRRFRIWEASHPVPDERGVQATTRTVDAVRQLAPGDVVIALISGGGSALFEAPRPPLTLDDIASVTQQLLRAGSPIQDLNAVRIPLSLVKGGGFRREIAAGRVITLILSDVLNNDPRIIASGPTIAGTHSASEALRTLEKYGVTEDIPPQVISFLRKSDEPREVEYPDDVVSIVGDNAAAIDAAMEYAGSVGRHAEIVWRQVEGEASELGRAWVELLSKEQCADVLIGGGEATVTVRGDGQGGRNTEFALAAAIELDRLGTAGWTVASLASDGQDALTDAAGAIVDGELIRRAREIGLDPADALRRNDSGSILKKLGALVLPGPTGTNVNDLYFAVRNHAS